MSKFPFRRSARPASVTAANPSEFTLRPTPWAHAIRRALRGEHLGLLGATASVALGALASGQVLANPLGGSVVAGNASIVQATPDTLNIVQSSNRAIINWQSFSIGAGETVNFLQPGARSVTLNRVTGNDPSAIFGSLNANGTVMLVNPNGVIFGANSRVDVGGLVATTANIADADFMAGDYRFSQASLNPNARVVNQGEISIRDAGLAALVAPGVENSGLIQARLGKVALGGAQTFALDFQGDGLLSFDASSVVRQAPQGAEGQALVLNTGRISADGGLIELSARAVQDVINQVINTEGVIAADTVGSRNGRIVLSGGDGAVNVAGTVQAQGLRAGERGGSVVATGHDVAVASGARVDVSGQSGGGRIALGSDGSAGAQWAQGSVSLARGAALHADAIVEGDGGQITLLSQQHTQFDGSISARGGAQGGDGGFSEVSSRQTIVLTGDVDLTAAHGRSGELLIDPATLRITDSDAASNTGNEVARGWLESRAATASITLEADGLITIDRMDGGLINLQTNASNSFTLRSLLSDGIVFADAGTEIRTQGGAINLEARGVGGTLTNIGKLTSNGGAINLVSNSGITLGNALNAGSGQIVVQSVAGSITGLNAGAILSGSRVSLLASTGNVGTANAALHTATANLVVETGGHFNVDNAAVLDSLSITSRHVLPNSPNTYALRSDGLDFAVEDGASYALQRIVQDGLDLHWDGDRGMTLGTLDVGGGDLRLVSTQGSLLAGADKLLRAASLRLSAAGAIGADGNALSAETAVLDATAQNGGLYLDNVGALSLQARATGNVAVGTTLGDLTVERLSANGRSVSLAAADGSILTGAGILLEAGSLDLRAGGAIGTAANRLLSNATSFVAESGVGGVHATLSGASANVDVTSGDGAIDLKTAGSTTARLISGTSSAANGITLEVASGNLQLGDVDAGSQADVTLRLLGTGTITSDYETRITGDRVTVSAPTTGYGAITINTATSVLDVQGAGAVTIDQLGAVRLDRLLSTTSSVRLDNAEGDITVVAVTAKGGVTLGTQGGSILDDGDAATGIDAASTTLSASVHLGTDTDRLATNATQLSLGSGGDIYVDNDGKLTSLSIDNSHATAGRANSIEVVSPFLLFSVTDDGNRYALTDIDSALLNNFSFTGDQTLVVGKVRGGSSSSVSLRATAGDILDDGNAQTRITGSRISLRADAGSLGDASHALNVNTTDLSLATAGNLYLESIADLATLRLSASHPDAEVLHTYRLTAPSLVFNLGDALDGYRFNTLTDISGLSFTFDGDRDLYLGDINLTRSGSLTLTSTTGSILDDGEADTRVLAGSQTLSANGGSVGSDTPLTLVASSIQANAGDGGVTLLLAMPTNASFNQSSFGASATGDISFTALQGDLLLNDIYTEGDVHLAVDNGAIAYGSGNVQGVNLTLDAGGAIGQKDKRVRLYTTGVVDAHSGGGDIALDHSGDAFRAGEIDAGGAKLYLSTSGDLLDDGNADTRLRGTAITLDAGGGLGDYILALDLETTTLTASASGAMNLANHTHLDGLFLTATSRPATIHVADANIGSFSLHEADGLYYLEDIGAVSALDFGFTGSSAGIQVGRIDTAGGSASLTSNSGSIVTDGNASDAHIAARRVALKATGSIGSDNEEGALLLSGTRELSLAASGNFHASSDAALTDLSLTVNSTSNTANTFAITGAGQTFDISDDGAGVHRLTDIGGGGLNSFSFTGQKRIAVGSINATDSVSLSTKAGSRNTITQASGSGIAAASVSLSTQNGSDDAAYSSIGASGTALKVNTAALKLDTTSSFFVNNTGALSALDLRLRHNNHGTNSPLYTYSLVSSGLTFSVSDNLTSTALSNVTRSGLNFSLDSDRAIAVTTVNTGGRSSGSVSLTSSGQYSTSPSMQPGISGGTITSGAVSLSAANYMGSVTNVGTVTNNLSLTSAGNVGVSNSGNLNSLSLTANVSNNSNSATYNISAGNISQNSISYSSGSSYGLLLSNFVASNLNLSVNTGHTLTAATVNTGTGGSVSLTSTTTIQGQTGSSRITAGAVSLNGSSVGVYASSSPLLLTTSRLSGVVSGHLNVSNTGNLTLGNLNLGSGRIVGDGSIFYDGATIKAPSLELLANNGSIGSSASRMRLDVRNLTLHSNYDLYVDGVSDFYSLSISNAHGQSGRQNVLQVSAPQLVFDIVDDGSRYVIGEVGDASGLDFSFTGDKGIDVAAIDVQRGRKLSLRSLDGALTSNGADINADVVSLTAAGAIGTDAAAFTTHALDLQLSAGEGIYVDNTLDLSALSFTNTQTGATGAGYRITSGPAFGSDTPTLDFVASDDGVNTYIDRVTDSTGLNFSATTHGHKLVYGTLDTAADGAINGGLLSLASHSGILARDGDSHLRAARLSFTTYADADIGSAAGILRFSAPRLALDVVGDYHLDSDVRLDELEIDTQRQGAGTSVYHLTAPELSYQASDAPGATTLDIADSHGLRLTYRSGRSLTLGIIDLGETGVLSLSTANSGASITSDGSNDHQVSAGILRLDANAGAIGAAGAAINASAASASLNAGNGGVRLALRNPVDLEGITANGDAYLENLEGDIALGSINLNGKKLFVTNYGGSILSGWLSNVSSVSLDAYGSIGNLSAISTSASGGGTTTLTAIARTNARGATGSIAVNEGYVLDATSLTAAGAVSLRSGYNLTARDILAGGDVNLNAGRVLSVGAIDAGSAAVSLTASEGNLTGLSSNSIRGGSVALSANYINGSTAYSIGSSGTRINVNTPVLTLTSPKDIYVTSSQALDALSITRTSSTYTSGGTIDVRATGLTATLSDGAITSLSNSGRDLDFTFNANRALVITTLNAGGGDVVLNAQGYQRDGSITAQSGSSLITAGSLSLSASNHYSGSTSTAGSIGTSGQALRTAVGSISANGPGLINLDNQGGLRLDNLSAGGNLSVLTRNGGDLVLGNISYGYDSALNLKAAGRILSGGGTLNGSTGTVHLEAVSGIGTADAAVNVSAWGTNPVNAKVTGAGDIHLSTSGLSGGLSTSTANGSTHVTASGAILLTSMTATGGDIHVTASGNVTADELSATGGGVVLTSTSGQVLGVDGDSAIRAQRISVSGASGVGSAARGLNTIGTQVTVSSDGGAIYLSPSDDSTLAVVSSNGGPVVVRAAKGLYLGNILSGGGNIDAIAAGALYAGNLSAGSGSINLEGQLIKVDSAATSLISGAAISLKAVDGIGETGSALLTRTGVLSTEVTGTGGIFIADDSATGVELRKVITKNGAIDISAAGTLTATQVTSTGDAVANTIRLSNTSGDMLLGAIKAGVSHGSVLLTSAGDIGRAGDDASNVTAQSLSMTAVGNIGSVTDLMGDDVDPLRLAVSRLEQVSADEHVALRNTGNLTLAAGSLSVADDGLLYVETVGDLDASALDVLPAGDFALIASGVLRVPVSGLSTSGSLRLEGGTDVLGEDDARAFSASAAKLRFVTGSQGGATTLNSATGDLYVLSTANDLTVENVGELSALSVHGTADVLFTNDRGFTVQGIGTTGAGKLLSVTALTGNLVLAEALQGNDTRVVLHANAGDVTLQQAASGLSSLTIRGTDISLAGVSSSGSQRYFGNVELTGSYRTDGALIGVQGNTVLVGDTTISTAGGAVNLKNVDGGHLLLIENGSGLVDLGVVGGTAALAGLTVSGTGNLRLDDAITTIGSQQYRNVLLTGDAVLTSREAGVRFDGLVDGNHGLKVVSEHGGDIEFLGAVGSDERIGALRIETAGATRFDAAIKAASLHTDAPGSVHIGTSIDTTGTQHYGERLTLESDVVLTASEVTLAQGADGAHALSIIGDARLLGAIGAEAALTALSISGAAQLDGGSIDTDGNQSFEGAVTLARNTVLRTGGGTLSFGSTLDGSHDLEIETGTGDAVFAGVVGATARLGALTVNSDGTSRFGAALKAASLQTDAGGTLEIAGGPIDTTGTQQYGEHLTLSVNTQLKASEVFLLAGVDGGHSLSIDGRATLGAVGVQQALSALSVSGGSLLKGNVTTTGTQQYGGTAIIEADTVLKASKVTLAQGAGGIASGAQSLRIDGNAAIGGEQGDIVQLATLTVTGDTVLDGGSFTTTGDQHYEGKVNLAGNHTLSSGGSLLFGSTLDSANGSSLTLSAGQDIEVLGVVGGTSPLGALVLSAGDTIEFAANVRVGSVQQAAAGGLTRFGGDLQADSEDGIDLSGNGFVFEGAVTAGAGAFTLHNSDDAGAITFSGPILAKGDFTQTGGADLYLPASITITDGGIHLKTVATLTGAQASFTTTGDIEMPGLKAAQTWLTLSSGLGALKIGLFDGDVLNGNLMEVAGLTVPTAGSAELFGSIGGVSGRKVARNIDSTLKRAPYFINATPWGGDDIIPQVIALTAPETVIPTTPQADPLFSLNTDPSGMTPRALDAYLSPAVLSAESYVSGACTTDADREQRPDCQI